MNTLLSPLVIASSSNIDFNLRSVKGNLFIVVESNETVTLTLYNGVGSNDPTQTSGTPIPYVVGSTVPRFEYSGIAYTVTASQPKAFNIIREEIGEWLRFGFTGASDTTVAIYGDVN